MCLMVLSTGTSKCPWWADKDTLLPQIKLGIQSLLASIHFLCHSCIGYGHQDKGKKSFIYYKIGAKRWRLIMWCLMYSWADGAFQSGEKRFKAMWAEVGSPLCGNQLCNAPGSFIEKCMAIKLLLTFRLRLVLSCVFGWGRSMEKGLW